MDHGVCRSCDLYFLTKMDRCPQCRGLIATIRTQERIPSGSEALPVPLASGRLPSSRPVAWEIAWECRSQFEGITLQAELDRHGILSWVRSLEVGCYPGVLMGDSIWGWVMVDKDDLETARDLISGFLMQIEAADRAPTGIQPIWKKPQDEIPGLGGEQKE